jgi:predicted anti-sigma-YlaC factor YlaD
MDCNQARFGISALQDEEAPLVDLLKLERHLAGCAACRAWRDQAHEVTRQVRVQLAVPAPAPSQQVLDAIAASSRRPGIRAATLTRIGLLLVAIVQIVVAEPMLLSGSYRGVPVHVAHEMGSFELALAVGFLVAAWRPSRAAGMRSIVAAAAVLLVATAVIDLLAGRTTLSDEMPHLLAVLGWLLLRELAALTPFTEDDQRVSVLALISARISRGAEPVLNAQGQDGSEPPTEISAGADGEDSIGKPEQEQALNG